jgi:biopolymer transport protein TolQ
MKEALVAFVGPLAQTAQPAATSIAEGVFARVLDSWVVSATLLVLLIMSVTSWFIIVYKAMYFRKVQSQSRTFVDAFWQSPRLDAIYKRAEELPVAPVSKVFKAAYVEISRLKDQREKGSSDEGIENVERALRRATQNETVEMERLIPFLATTGSAAPFIGLFGTVWGIMEAFSVLGMVGSGQNMMRTVVPHIAEALVATAIGLLAAIPAVMGYNYFVRRIRVSLTEIENFSAEFLNIVQRHVLR